MELICILKHWQNFWPIPDHISYLYSVKSCFHLVFATVLVLGSIIFIQAQKSEGSCSYADAFESGALELVAEIPAGCSGGSLFSDGIDHPLTAFESEEGSLKFLAFLIQRTQIVQRKTQLQIHLELKPILGLQAGRTIYRPLRNDPPPIC